MLQKKKTEEEIKNIINEEENLKVKFYFFWLSPPINHLVFKAFVIINGYF